MQSCVHPSKLWPPNTLPADSKYMIVNRHVLQSIAKKMRTKNNDPRIATHNAAIFQLGIKTKHLGASPDYH